MDSWDNYKQPKTKTAVDYTPVLVFAILAVLLAGAWYVVYGKEQLARAEARGAILGAAEAIAPTPEDIAAQRVQESHIQQQINARAQQVAAEQAAEQRDREHKARMAQVAGCATDAKRTVCRCFTRKGDIEISVSQSACFAAVDKGVEILR